MKTLQPLVGYRLFCGRGIPPEYKYEVSEKYFYEFLERHNYFENITIWPTIGYWRGNREHTFVIEVGDDDLDKVNSFIESYIAEFDQQNIWVQQINFNGGLAK